VTGDGTRTFKVVVKGTNDDGSAENDSAESFEVISEPARTNENPQIYGEPYPGETLVGTVGAWEDPTTGFQRQWLRCFPDGTACSFIYESDTADLETGPSYNVRESDLGYTIRLRVTADVNGDITDGQNNAKPDPTEVDSAPSGLIIPRPLPAVGGPGGTGDGGAGGGPGDGGAGVDTTLPVLASLSLTNRRFVVGSDATPTVAGRRRTPRGTTFRFRLSEPATAVLTIHRMLPGRRVGRACRAPSRKLRKRRKCTRLKRAGALTRRNLPAGANSVAFSGRIGRKKLAVGSYQVTVVGTDAAGNRSRAAKAKFTVLRR
jgi:hypothetical protein